MMPMFLQRSNGTCLGISLSLRFQKIYCWDKQHLSRKILLELLAAGF